MIIKEPKIFVIVVTYNGAEWIEQCFNSLLNSSASVTVIAVDNGSTDTTVQITKEKFPSVIVVETGANLGFGRANNLGFQKAIANGADYVLLLNQDAWISTKAVEQLTTLAGTYPDFGIISPFHYNWDGTKVDHFFLRMVNPDDCPGFLCDKFLNTTQDIYALNFIHAACWLISKDCLMMVGGFDPLFFHYGEDNDYVLRAKRCGFKTGITTVANVYHAGFFDVTKQAGNAFHLRKIDALLELKKMTGSLKANYFLYIKGRLDSFSTLLMAGHFRKSGRELKLIAYSLSQLKRIKQSRRQSLQPTAFLQA